MKTFYEKIAGKRSESLGNTMSYIRTKNSFSLLRTTLRCIRGTRNGKKKALPMNEVDFITMNIFMIVLYIFSN